MQGWWKREGKLSLQSDWLVSHEGVAPNAARALCRGVGELSPVRKSSSSWGNSLWDTTEVLLWHPYFTWDRERKELISHCLFWCLKNLLSPLCHDYLSPHSPPNPEAAAGISASRSPLICKGSRAVVQTHLLQGFGVEKSACDVCTEIQVVLLWLHPGVLTLYCCLAS